MKSQKFTPLVFLASLGAGGIAVIPFALMQYTVEHGKGLITRAGLWANGYTGIYAMHYLLLEAVMVVFTLLHFTLTILFSVKLAAWIKEGNLKPLIENPLKNSAIIAPLISFIMTMNLFIGPIRYFIPAISSNFQKMFLPAMVLFSVMFVIVIFTEIHLLGISFKKGFDIDKINFGWLLHPFVLGMLSTVGTGIAAMSMNPAIAGSAAFLSMISISMGMFLLLVKMVVIFKSHFSAESLPEKHFLPSFLIVIPNITLFAISLFRFGHYLENYHGFHMNTYFYIVIGFAFAFEIWYMLFGISLLIPYFRNNHFKEFYVTQWGLICPLVAFIVLGSFTYKTVIPGPFLYAVLISVLFITVALYFELLIKHIKCGNSKNTGSDETCLAA